MVGTGSSSRSSSKYFTVLSLQGSHVLNWTNGTATRKSAFYRFSVGSDVESSDDIPPPELVLESPPGAFFLDFVSGGYTDGDECLVLNIAAPDVSSRLVLFCNAHPQFRKTPNGTNFFDEDSADDGGSDDEEPEGGHEEM